ncbi:hypothetical protein [Hydrogenophaga taeniospiralis]|uniref:hypothetical protein n=1 Tax=Hydrogenophaga taeniospiralis TaxID=65656 RepID=UPI001CF95AF8|nr:hypothetical protein [Hydrogenophaga taeniospiralis]UCU94936.1 hypothetical protein KI616_03375 [Hydrogenophaga taeniospiralis]
MKTDTVTPTAASAEDRKFFRDMAVLMTLAALAGTGMYLTYQDALAQDAEVVTSAAAGSLIAMRVDRPGGLLLLPVVTVLTSTATYRLEGALVAVVGDELALEHRASGKHYVCVSARTLCVEVIASQPKE